MKPKAKSKHQRGPTLKQLVAAVRAAGGHVTFALEDKRMPRRMPNDHEHVLILLDASERTAALGEKWMKATAPNPIAAQKAFEMAWAYGLAAAWLRCKLKGELLFETEEKKP